MRAGIDTSANGAGAPSETRSIISRCGSGWRVSRLEKYRRPAGPAAARNSSVPRRFHDPVRTDRHDPSKKWAESKAGFGNS